MAIMYAPYIESIIPAFGPVLKIPYKMNQAVSLDKVKKFVVKIMDVNNNPIKYLETDDITKNPLEFLTPTGEEQLTLDYYKLQLAYSDGETLPQNLVYSSVGVGKYFGQHEPTISVSTEESAISYNDNGSDELIYSLLVFDNNDKQIQEIFVNSQNNKIAILPIGKESRQIKATTLNGYTTTAISISSLSDILPNKDVINTSDEHCAIYTNGSKIILPSENQYYIRELGGYYCIFQNNDIFFETGENPLYYNGQLKQWIITKQKINNETYKNLPFGVDYEDMYLQDISKTLCVKFNPKVSFFKTTLQESKQDSIGGKYPFFYRNGNLGYKEFSINGLISYHMDENEEFMTQEQLGLSAAAPTHNLTGYNIVAERKFRNAVLDWLNNGEVKLFKSPTEGMYLVRLMNISLSPEDKLGRMIYSFSATAYEVDEINYETLLKHKLISKIEGIDYVIR